MFLPTIYWQDGKRTKQFLEMLVDDLMIDYSITQQSGKSSNIDLGANTAKVLAKYRSGSENIQQIEGKVSKSDSALFKDLYTIMEEKGMIQKLIGFDESIWNQLKLGEFVELTGEFKQSPAELVFSSMMDMLEQFKGFFESAETKEEFDLASSVLRFKKATIIIQPYIDEETNYKFFTSLDTDNFVEDRYDLEGEFTILAKIKRIYKPHQKIDLVKFLPGKLKVNKKQLLTFLPEIQKSDEILFEVDDINEESFEIKGPVIELTPIAIYQE
ncbi:DUF6414 family protein [Ornithinibacillus halophilus]|uniref:Uncharacterized protein n=1 Tax=Ornithinibacillus halophilus TaxID=930117 RepID=A0A1M5JB27_9BACI|nr:hypothetical protein [Ornithinibacillus halophilus]SHG37796.1 hypothetical protein SAMN05216225_102919 [Ornithinibacillus halophilus]